MILKSKIIYFSRTGNLSKFINKLNYDNVVEIVEDLIIEEPYILLVSTINFGEVPIEYKKFLKNNSKYLIGVAGSGNRNWGKNFAIATDKVANKFNVPIIHKFELSGNEHDVKKFKEGVGKIENEYKTHRIK